MEHLCANTHLMLGETLTGISKDMDLTSFRVPLGVCAGIAPFNFPAMIPLWMFPTGEIDCMACFFSSVDRFRPYSEFKGISYKRLKKIMNWI